MIEHMSGLGLKLFMAAWGTGILAVLAWGIVIVQRAFKSSMKMPARMDFFVMIVALGLGVIGALLFFGLAFFIPTK